MNNLFQSLNQYRDHLIKSGVSPATIERKLSSIRAYLSFLEYKQSITSINKTIKNENINSDYIARLAALGIQAEIDSGLSRISQFINNDLKKLRYTLPYALKYSRPKWLINYQKTLISKLVNFSFLAIFIFALGIGGYDQFVKKTQKQGQILGSVPISTPTKLSFQGRLTDSSGIPITSPTSFTFNIYNVGTGETALWIETKTISPDTNGIFNTYLGDINPIDSTLFRDNTNLYLGVTIGADLEMTSRQQIATVGYAFNSQYLQGYGVGTSYNEIPFIDRTGTLTLATAGPTLLTTSGIFKIESPTLSMMNSSGNVGIGTSSPTQKLDVKGNLNIGGSGFFTNLSVGNTNPAYKLDVTGDGRFTTNLSVGASLSVTDNVSLSGLSIGTGTTAVFVDASGNLTKRVLGSLAFSSDAYDNYQYWQLQANGVGTTNVNSTALVNFTAGTGISLSQNGSVITIANVGAGTTYSAGNGITLNSTNFQLGGTLSQLTKIDLNSNNFSFYGTGNVGIGTTGPTALFQINNVGGGQTGPFIYIPSTGRVGIGNTATNYYLQVGSDTRNGNGAYVTDAGVWTDGSSRTFKEDYQPIDKKDLLNKVMSLEISNFKYKDSDNRGISPFAEDFYQAFGLGGNEKYLAAGHVAGVALVAIQEQQNEIATSNVAIASLSAQLNFTNSGNLILETKENTYNGLLADDTNFQFFESQQNPTIGGTIFNLQSIFNNSIVKLTDQTGQSINKIGAFAEIVSGKVRTGLLVTTDLIAQNIAAKKIVSPLVETEQLKAQKISSDFISPLSGKDFIISLNSNQDSNQQDSKIAADSGFGKLLIKGNVEITGHVSAQALDVAGNVGIGQTLEAQDISANQLQISENLTTKDATVTGELVADSARIRKLRAESIEGLEAIIASLSTQNISSGSENSENSDGQNHQYTGTPENQNSGLSDNLISPISSDSLSLSEVSETQASTSSTDLSILNNLGNLDVLGNLKVLGITTLAQTVVAGSLTQDGTFVIDEGNSINVIGGTLYLQNKATGGIDLLAGKVTIDKDGNAVFNGSLLVKELKISDSAGIASITSGSAEIKIKSPYVSEKSLVYLTPIGSTNNQVLYIKEVNDIEKMITIAVDRETTKELKFNWWIIN